MMKHMKASKRITRVISLLITLSLLISLFSVNAFADNNAIISQSSADLAGVYHEYGKLINSLETSKRPNEHEGQAYVEDEVLIGIVDNETTRSMSFSSVYSDEYQSINQSEKGRSLNKIAAEPVEAIAAQLNIDLDITEMKLLNPSSNKRSSDGKYQIDGKQNNIYCLKLNGISVEEAIEELSDNPLISYAEPNYIAEVCAMPNDEFYNQQIAMVSMRLPQAWNTTTGSKNVVVGIIDTGLDGTHPDLQPNLWTNPYNPNGTGCSKCLREDDINGYNFSGAGNNNVPVGGTPTCITYHGTHVAGIVGAKGNNAIGVSGVNWNVSLAWLGCGYSGPDRVGGIVTSSVVTAIHYAEEHDIPILNCSIKTGYSQAIFDEISAYSGLVVASAGNDTRNIDHNLVYPACYELPNIIAVASTDSDGNLSDFSNFGKFNVDVAAPGEEILSTIGNSGYNYMDGTSMAAPQVAGIAALIKAAHPNYSTQQIKAAICGTVQQQGKTYNITYDGGIVDAAAAVAVTSSSLKSVTFNLNYTGAPASFVDYVVAGKKVNEPMTDPTRDGYAFEGWFTTSTGNTRFNFNSPINNDTTIYAKWTELPNSIFSYGISFPDYRFRNEVLRLVNAIDNGTRTAASMTNADPSYLRSIKTLDISGKKIRDISGIKKLLGLKTVDCSNNYIKGTLSIASDSVEILDCSYNQISRIILENPNGLKELDCSYNDLSSIQATSFTNMTHLDCSNNLLGSLTTNQALEFLFCNNSELTELNVEASTELDTLYCNSNNLYIINTVGLDELENVDVTQNQMNAKSDVIGYNNWDYPVGIVFYNAFAPQRPWEDNPYTDVASGSYYYKAVQYVHDKNYMRGPSSTVFGPNASITRAELAAILYLMAGKPSVSNLSLPFTDVSSSSEYVKAIKWAYNNGNQVIMGGTSSTTFNPDGLVTKETVAVTLDRYAARCNISLRKLRDYAPFNDDAQISSWARASVTEMYEAGIINGTLNHDFYPTNTMTRGELAVTIRKFDVIRLYL